MSEVEQILEQRGNTNGDFANMAKITQRLHSIIRDNAVGHLTDVHRESLHMICHKLGRITAGDPNVEDHWDDIAGYATLVSRELVRKKLAKG